MTRDRHARRHWLTGRRIRCGAPDGALTTVLPDQVTCTRCRRFMAADDRTARETTEQRQAFLRDWRQAQAFLRDWRQAQATDLQLAADDHADAFFASLTPATVTAARQAQLRRLGDTETAMIRRSTPA